jgi:modulator of FtsH protease
MEQTSFLTRVLTIFSLSLIVAVLGVYMSRYVPSGYYLFLVILEFILIFAVNFASKRPTLAPIFLFLFTFISGVMIGPLIYVFFNIGAGAIVFEALSITAIIFILLTSIVYFFNINLVNSKIWIFLLVGLIGIIIASIVNIFLRNPLFNFYISVVVVLIFSGYILYDISNILENPNMTNEYVAALALYLDFVNIFIALLNILGFLQGKD